MEDPTTIVTSTSSADDDWPRHKIAEPHEYNDVLLNGPQKQDATEEEPIPRSSNLLWIDNNVLPFQRQQHPQNQPYYMGNERLWELIAAHRNEYEQRPKMEKPLVAVQILNTWRNQSPTGRFLLLDSDTNLWKDVGDKKARSRISKALRHVVALQQQQEILKNGTILDNNGAATTKIISQCGSSITSSSTSSNDKNSSRISSDGVAEEEEKEVEQACVISYKSSHPPLVSSTVCDRQIMNDAEQEEEKKANEHDVSSRIPPHPSAAAAITKNRTMQQIDGPAIPRFRKLNKYSRHISEQLHASQDEGKIYGRSIERDKLDYIYRHQRQQHAVYLEQGGPSSTCAVVDLVLISGKMGVGKSTLARTLQNHISDDNTPFFLQGKFEHCKWTDPNSVFVAIVADFCHQLQKRNDPLLTSKYRNAIRQSLHDDLSLLENLVPALSTLLNENNNTCDNTCGGIPKCCDMGTGMGESSYGCMALHRVKEVLSSFLQTIAAVSSQHSIIVLFEDVHFASETPIEIMFSLVANQSNCGVLFLATFRSEEEYIDRYFTRSIAQLKTNHMVKVNEIHLDNLSVESVHSMLSETLLLTEGETQSLISIVFSLTRGNPMFINELLRNFQENALLCFDDSRNEWTIHIDKIQSAFGGKFCCIFDIFRSKLLDLPRVILETLKISACLMSTQVDEAILKMIDTVGAVSQHLKYADILGIFHYRDGQYYFASDSAKQAIYELIPEPERAAFHLKISQRLWLHLQENQSSEFYATLMTQLLMGDKAIAEEEDRQAVAAIYLDAGRKAAKHVGFSTSWFCLSRGIALVSLDSTKTWGREKYDLSLSLYNTAIEVCYCNAEFSELENLISEVLYNARTFEDSLLARCTMIYFLGSRNRQFEAIETALETLDELGESFPSSSPSSWRVYAEALHVKRLLNGLSHEAILKKPRMKDAKKIGAMQVMNHVALTAVYAAPNLAALLSFRMVELTIKHGLSALSSVGFAFYGMILCR